MATKNLGVAIETDVRCTKDGHVLISHDNNLKRITGVDTNVSETNLADLPKSYIGKLNIEFGHTSDYTVK